MKSIVFTDKQKQLLDPFLKGSNWRLIKINSGWILPTEFLNDEKIVSEIPAELLDEAVIREIADEDKYDPLGLKKLMKK